MLLAVKLSALQVLVTHRSSEELQYEPQDLTVQWSLVAFHAKRGRGGIKHAKVYYVFLSSVIYFVCVCVFMQPHWMAVLGCCCPCKRRHTAVCWCYRTLWPQCCLTMLASTLKHSGTLSSSRTFSDCFSLTHTNTDVNTGVQVRTNTNTQTHWNSRAFLLICVTQKLWVTKDSYTHTHTHAVPTTHYSYTHTVPPKSIYSLVYDTTMWIYYFSRLVHVCQRRVIFIVLTCPLFVDRMLHADRRTLQNPVRNILDGELLNKYLYLSTMERSELAKKIGTTSDIVSKDSCSSLLFGKCLQKCTSFLCFS